MAALDSLRRDARPWARALFNIARSRGYVPIVTSSRRTRAQQAYLYRMAMRGGSRFPANPPGLSLHEHGLAFDMVVNTPAAQREMGRLWSSWGFRWGGEADPIHFDVSRS